MPRYPRSHEAGRWWRTPDHRVVPAPDFRPLRLVAVPRTGLEVAKLLVFHLIELDIELHELIVLVPVKDGYVVTRTESQRSPDKRNSSPRQQVAGIFHMREVVQLKCKVMHANDVAPEEIH